MVKIEKIPVGYHATEAGILPVDWQVKRLNDVATELIGCAGQDLYETVSISAGIGFVNQAEKFGKELSGKQYAKYIVLHKGDFSYNKGNSKTFPQGCIYRLNDRESAAVPNVFESFRIKEQNADYYEQLFLSGFLNKQLYSRINRGVRDDGLLNLTGKDFYSCMVPVPPKDEQKKIAELLSCCDRQIDLKQQLIIELQRLKNGLLQAMFPAKGHSKPNVRFPGFTDAWEQRKLGELGETYSGLSGKTKDDFGHGQARFVTYMNVFSNPVASSDMTEAVEIDNSQNQVLFGDVLFTASSETPEEVGMSSVWLENADNTYLNSFCFGYRPTIAFNLYYLAYMLRSSSIRKKITFLAQGISRYNISKNKMMDIEIPIPSVAEQRQIGEYFCDLDNLITLHQRELEEMKKKKKSLAKLLLIGRVRVPT